MISHGSCTCPLCEPGLWAAGIKGGMGKVNAQEQANTVPVKVVDDPKIEEEK